MRQPPRDERLEIARSRGGTEYVSRQNRRVRIQRVEDRFATKHRLEENGCWRWTAAIRPGDGYGTFQLGVDLGTMLAHRASYLLHVGPVPAGTELDHLCRNRWCVNPEHLEPVSHQENLLRAVDYRQVDRKTECYKGHSVSEHGILRADGYFTCRTCRADNQRAWRAARRAHPQPGE